MVHKVAYIARGYAISITNDGLHFGEPDSIVIYNSSCVNCTKAGNQVLCQRNVSMPIKYITMHSCVTVCAEYTYRSNGLYSMVTNYVNECFSFRGADTTYFHILFLSRLFLVHNRICETVFIHTNKVIVFIGPRDYNLTT